MTNHSSGAAIVGLTNVDEGTAEVENTIVASNETDCTGHVTSLGHNLIADPTRCSMVLLSSDETGDPGLGDFVDDGTPGNGHFPLLPSSKAVDGGNNTVCPPTDQLGQTRPKDGDQNGTEDCDIGAFEFQPPITNQAPIVSAGGAQTITLPSAANLNGTVMDDGLPNPPATVTTTWSKVSGPGSVTFENSSAVDTTASFSLPGTYLLRLTADDGGLNTITEVTITVKPPPPVNQPPMVNAGSDQMITLPRGASLDGKVTDDGLPSGTLTTMWSKVSGPGTVVFGNATGVDTAATFSEAGTYVLRLTADDGVLMNNAEVTVTVDPNPATFTCTAPSLAGDFSGVVAGKNRRVPFSEFMFVTFYGDGTLATFEVKGEPGNVAQILSGTGTWRIFDMPNCFAFATVVDNGSQVPNFFVANFSDEGHMILFSTPFDPSVQAAGVLWREGN